MPRLLPRLSLQVRAAVVSNGLRCDHHALVSMTIANEFHLVSTAGCIWFDCHVVRSKCSRE